MRRDVSIHTTIIKTKLSFWKSYIPNRLLLSVEFLSFRWRLKLGRLRGRCSLRGQLNGRIHNGGSCGGRHELSDPPRIEEAKVGQILEEVHGVVGIGGSCAGLCWEDCWWRGCGCWG